VGILFTRLEEIVVRNYCEVVVGFLQRINIFLRYVVLVDDILGCQKALQEIYLDIPCFGERFDNRFDEMAVKEDGDGVGFLQGMSKTFLSQRVICSNNGNRLRNST